jgi:RNA polymerase sigma factor (TIGR02999 family)
MTGVRDAHDGAAPRTPRSMDALVEALYSTLREIAGRALRRGGPRATLDPTDLVHDCYVKLSHAAENYGLDRVGFVALAAHVIRNELVDRARRRGAKKRGGGRARLTLHDELTAGEGPPVDLIDLDDALSRLSALDERQAKVVELRFFGGLTIEETAQVLGIKPRAVADEWTMARAWLKRELSRGLGGA